MLRLPAIIGLGAVSVTVVAQGAYIYKTRRQVEALTGEVQRLASERLDDGQRGGALDGAGARVPRFTGGGERPQDDDGDEGARLPPPRFVPGGSAATASGAAVPLPPVLDTPQARDQLRQFVAAELQRERDERQERERARREEEQQRRVEGTAKALGLDPEQGRRFGEVMAATQTARRELRDKVQSGQIAQGDIGREMAALRERTDQQLTQVLGPEGMKKLEELRQQDRRGGGGPPGREGGFARGAGPWGQRGRGGEQPPPAAPPASP